MTNISSHDASIATDDQAPSTAIAVFDPKAFDYSGLDAPVAEKVRGAVAEIQVQLRLGDTAGLVIGQRLLEVKDDLAHGQFERWLDVEFEMSARTARNLMQRATFIARLPKDKSEIIAGLGDTVQYKLSAPSTPPSVWDEVVLKAQSGEKLRGTDIDHLILEAKGLRKKQASQTSRADDKLVAVDGLDCPAKMVEFVKPKVQLPLIEAAVAAPDETVDDLLSNLSEMIALTDEQRRTYPLSIGRMEATLQCLRVVTEATGNYSLLFLLGDLLGDGGGLRALQCSLKNFCEYQKTLNSSETADASEEKLAA